MSIKPIRSILFVCLGNICRSPLAEGVFRAVLSERGDDQGIVLDSA
ncbi:MAG: low molecular weight phosphotyrosine protein phosphatase, partial [Mesorhizobium sp.]